METITALAAPGTIVRYHGSITREHGLYVVSAAAGGRYTLMDRDYCWFTISQVRPQSVTPAGDVIPMCAGCGHPSEHLYGKSSCFSCRDLCTGHGE